MSHTFTCVSAIDFAEILPSKQHPLQWLPSLPCKKESINIPVTPIRLLVESPVHRASLSLSLSMLSLTTLPFPLLLPSALNFAWIKQTSPFISVNYHPLLAMSGSSNIQIKPVKCGSALHSDWESMQAFTNQQCQFEKCSPGISFIIQVSHLGMSIYSPRLYFV